MRTSLRVVLLAALPSLVSAACGDDGPTEPRPTTGTIAVRLQATGEDQDGIMVQIDGRMNLWVPIDAEVYARHLSPGTHTVRLQSHQDNCAPSGVDRHEATVVAGDTVQVVFTMACEARIGILRVVTATTGTEVDDDGYTVQIDGQTPRPIGTSAELLFSVREGIYTVMLGHIARNCDVDGPTVRGATIAFRGRTDVPFVIRCHQSGAVEFTAATSGIERDADGYAVRLTGGLLDTTVALASDGAVSIAKLAPRRYQATVLDVALNCDVSGTHRMDVEVTAGGHASVPLAVACGALTRLAYTSYEGGNANVYAIASDGSGTQRLTDDPAFDGWADWSPDGSKIVFVSTRTGNSEIHVMNADGSNVVRLTQDPGEDWAPRWSPDGASIVFVSSRDGDNEIFRMSADGSNVLRLTDNLFNDRDPAWSPDGRRIAFISDRAGGTEVFLMNADGTAQAQLTDGPETVWGSLDWSPDGTRIAYSRGDCAYYYTCNRSIHIVGADGSGDRRIVTDHGDDIQPRWSPDGRRIAFAEVLCGGYYCYGVEGRVVVMRPDGTDRTVLVDRVAEAPAWRR